MPAFATGYTDSGMQHNSRAEIEELVRRLQTRPYRDSDIREAAGVMADMLAHAESLALGAEFLAAKSDQVQKLGFGLLECLAAQAPQARAVLDQPMVQAQRKKLFGAPAADAGASNKPGYTAMAEIIKMWVREEKSREPKKPQDWLPRR